MLNPLRHCAYCGTEIRRAFAVPKPIAPMPVARKRHAEGMRQR